MKFKNNKRTSIKNRAAEDSSDPQLSSPKITNSRRFFVKSAAMVTVGLGLQQISCSTRQKVLTGNPDIQGFEESAENLNDSLDWVSISDRKIRVGIVGYGESRFGAAFGFQDHPNVEVVAVSDLYPDRLAALAKATGAKKTYPSLEELVKDDSIEAVFVATDAPSHGKHVLEVLAHGKHVACAVPAVFASVEEANQIFEAVKTSGLKYMLFETSMFRSNLYAMRQIYKSGGFGKLIYTEGEYYHYMAEPIAGYNNWRNGLPPQLYPTHSNAYYIGVSEGTFTEVSCLGMPSILGAFQPSNNVYNNPFATEIAMFRTSEGGMSRMAVSWDTPGDHGERGRVRGQRGSFYSKYEGLDENTLLDLRRPGLPPNVNPGGHGGSHGRLTDEFISAILQDRKPLVDIGMALNMSVPGIIAHQSALKNGENMKIPQYKL